MKRARGEIKNRCARLATYATRDAAERLFNSAAPGMDAAKIGYCRKCSNFHIYIH